MDFRRLSKRVNHLIYWRAVSKLTPAERTMADTWTLRLIRERHPTWSEEQIHNYFENLLHVKTKAVKEWQMRLGIDVFFGSESDTPPPRKK